MKQLSFLSVVYLRNIVWCTCREFYLECVKMATFKSEEINYNECQYSVDNAN